MKHKMYFYELGFWSLGFSPCKTIVGLFKSVFLSFELRSKNLLGILEDNSDNYYDHFQFSCMLVKCIVK